jgi:hypothetical protein
MKLFHQTPDPPSEEFEDAARKAEDRERRIDALEQRVRVIEIRFRTDDAPSARYRKPA